VSATDIMTRIPDLLPGLTTSGRRQLNVEAREWERMSNAIERVMRFA